MDSLVKSVLGDQEFDLLLNEKIGTVVCFKSISTYFYKERSGIKNNTMREIDDGDIRFIKLKEGEAKYIKIIEPESRQWFIREIQDISIYKGWMMITWNNGVQINSIKRN